MVVCEQCLYEVSVKLSISGNDRVLRAISAVPSSIGLQTEGYKIINNNKKRCQAFLLG